MRITASSLWNPFAGGLNTKMKFKDIEAGEGFFYKDEAYLKIIRVEDFPYNAVRIEDGLMVKISENAVVNPFVG